MLLTRKSRVVLLAVAVSMAVPVLGVAGSAGAAPGNRLNAKSCQKGGWTQLARSDGSGFTSDSECVAYAAQGGVLIRATHCYGSNQGYDDARLTGAIGTEHNTTFYRSTDGKCDGDVLNQGSTVAAADAATANSECLAFASSTGAEGTYASLGYTTAPTNWWLCTEG